MSPDLTSFSVICSISGNNLTLAKAVTPRKDNFYLYKNVPEQIEISSPRCSVEVNDKMASEMDRYNLFKENLTGNFAECEYFLFSLYNVFIYCRILFQEIES